MNPQQLQQKIAYYFEKLPPQAQEVFSKMEWLEKLQGVSRVYALSDEQMETLGTETTLVLLGIVNLDEYEKILNQELHLPRLTLDKIVEEINRSILTPIRPDLETAFTANASANTPEQIELGTKLDERFAKLSKDAQEAVTSTNYYGELYAIAEENNLSIAQMGMLEECVTRVVIGEENGDKLESALQARVGVSAEQARKLANEINEKILKEVRKIMMGNGSSIVEPLKEDKILEAAGIKIVEPGETLTPAPKPAPQVMPEGKVDLTIPELPAPLNAPAPAPAPTPVLAQKFAGSFKIESKKTEHNIIPPINSYPKGEDPYRIKPE